MNKVIFTQTAEDDYLSLLGDLSRVSLDQALALDEKMNKLIENLAQFKYFCPPTRNFPKFRRCVITKYLSLVYEVGESSITIISIFNNRNRSPFT